MKDRIPTYPNRIRLTPVSGQANVYDLERADEPRQVGTPLNKETLMSDEVAELFGGDDTWTPNDLLKSYKLYRWHKYDIHYAELTYSPTYDYRTGSSSYTYYMYFGVYNSSGTAPVIDYADSYYVDDSGNFVLNNPTRFSIPVTTNGTDYNAAIKVLQDKYFKIISRGGGISTNLKTTDVYSLSSQYYGSTTGGKWCVNRSFFTAVRTIFNPTDLNEEVTSENENAYPTPNGVQDGFYYSYLGTRMEGVKGAVKVKTGAYVGTGTSGTLFDPVEWDFEGEPLLLIIKEYNTDYTQMMPFIGLGEADFLNYGWMYSWSGIYFRYQSSAYARLVGKNHLERYGSYMTNDSGKTYYYMLFYR